MSFPAILERCATSTLLRPPTSPSGLIGLQVDEEVAARCRQHHAEAQVHDARAQLHHAQGQIYQKWAAHEKAQAQAAREQARLDIEGHWLQAAWPRVQAIRERLDEASAQAQGARAGTQGNNPSADQ